MKVQFTEDYVGNGFAHVKGATQDLPDDVAKDLINRGGAIAALAIATDEPPETASADPAKPAKRGRKSSSDQDVIEDSES